MIRLEGIIKEFPLGSKIIQVLKGISVLIQKGEFVSIMGPSGSGKSTLSSILGCLATPTKGQYYLMEQDISQLSSNKLATIRNQKIGFIFQDFNLLDGLTAVENVMLPLFYDGVSRGEAKKRALKKLDAVGLLRWNSHFPRQLSGGQKQRVAIARALVNEPLFLFADEPTGALDQKTGNEIMGLMQKLNSSGHTVVQVTHSLSHCNYGKRILFLVDGLIVRDENVKQPIFALNNSEPNETSALINNLWKIAQNNKTQGALDLSCMQALYERYKEDPSSLIEAASFFCRCPDAEAIIQDLMQNKDWVIRSEVVKHCKKMEKLFMDIRKRRKPWK